MQEVCNLLDCCEKKSRQLFAELEKTGLIQRRRQHFGKPPCIYVMDFTESKEENGKNCTYGEQNPYQNGKNCTYEEQNPYQNGKNCTYEEQNLYQSGKNCTYEEQNLYQSGKNCTYEEQNLYQSGKNCTYEGQNLHLSAVNSAPVNRQNLHLNAVNSAPTDRQNLHSNKNNINNTDFSDIFMRDNKQQQELEPDVVVAKLRQSITIPFTDNDYFTLYRKADKNISLIQNLHDFLIRLEEAGLEVLEILLRNYQSCRILEKRDSVQEQYAPKPPESQQSILAKLKEFIHHSLTDKELLLLYQKANGNLALIREKYAVMQQQNVHNVMGFLLTAIKENYQPPQTNICRNHNRFQETKSEEDFLEEVYQEELQKMLDKVQFDDVLCDRQNPYRFFSPDVLESLRGLAKLLVFEQEPDFFSKNSFYNANQAVTLAENLSYPLIKKVLDFYEKTDKENLLEVMFSYFFPQNQENQEKIKAEKLQAVFA